MDADILEAIKTFDEAHSAMKAAEQTLGEYIDPLIQKADTVDKLMELAEQLPRNFMGVRRVYEKAYRIENERRRADNQNVAAYLRRNS